MASNAHAAPQTSYPSDCDVRALKDVLFFLVRDINTKPDIILSDLGYGRAHHRCLHWINRRPGLKVGDLLAILDITKQSLTRVLGPLIRDGYVLQTPGRTDRRQRLLTLSDAGIALEQLLFDSQYELMATAYRQAGPVAVDMFLQVAHKLISTQGHKYLSQQAVLEPDSPPVEYS